jgi:hypothetical protein
MFILPSSVPPRAPEHVATALPVGRRLAGATSTPFAVAAAAASASMSLFLLTAAQLIHINRRMGFLPHPISNKVINVIVFV